MAAPLTFDLETAFPTILAMSFEISIPMISIVKAIIISGRAFLIYSILFARRPEVFSTDSCILPTISFTVVSVVVTTADAAVAVSVVICVPVKKSSP